MGERRIGDLLVDAGVITRGALEDIIREIGDHPNHDRRLLTELYRRRLVLERPLCVALARRVGAPVAVVSECTIDLAAVKLVPERVVRERMALPIVVDERTITVATPDPDQPGVAEPIMFATGRRMVPILGLHGVLGDMIERAYQAIEEGKPLLGNGHAPKLEVAAVRPDRDVADAIAKKIIEGLEDPSGSHKLGAVRLKRVLVEHEDSGPGDIIEKNFVEEPLQKEPPPPGKPLVVVVDDDPEIRHMLRRVLEHDGLNVREAGTGDEAITLLRSLRPHLLLLDAMLPGVHGFEICAQLKKSEIHRSLPIIMISAVYRGWTVAREIQEVHGAEHFVEKPFDLTFLRRLIADVLKRAPPQVAAPSAVAARVKEIKARHEKHVHDNLWFAAAADVETWLSLDPFDARAWLERANLCAQAGDLVGALGAYEASSIYDPKLLLAHVGLAHVADVLGFTRKARTAWERARALAPDEATKKKIDEKLK